MRISSFAIIIVHVFYTYKIQTREVRNKKIFLWTTPSQRLCITLFLTLGKFLPKKAQTVQEYYVRVLTELIRHTNRVITFDNWFTTVNICEKLHNEYGLEGVGTIHENKREISKSLVTSASAGVSRYAYQNNKQLTLVSLSPKRNKVVVAIHHPSKWSKRRVW